ncbi:hypothetical protein [Paraburkholderia fungorum]|uniref:hypothetical protein n=1 Tax=Paraburkholderia fungorum TaxID=134537 RepID=UPI0038BC1DDD
MELGDAPGGVPISDTEIERICRVLQIALDRYEAQIREGRPATENAKLQTIQALLAVFAAHFGGEPDEWAEAEIKFVHVALNAAGISHPPPDTHMHEFKALMQLARSVG